MMSVILKNQETGKTFVYVKGASDAMETKLVAGESNSKDLALADNFAT